MADGFLLQAAPFVHPTLAVAAAALGLVPIIIHLINRQRYRRLDWAAMRFLEAAHRRSAQRMRLQNWLLMLARVAVVVLLGLAVARPYVPASAIVPAGSSKSHRILLIDNTLSMRARDTAGATRFDVARHWAQQFIASLPSTDAVSLVTLAMPAEPVIAHPAYDRRIIRDLLRGIKPTQRQADIVGALEAAMQVLRNSDVPAGNRTVYLISDFRRRAWQGETEGMPTSAVQATRRLADELIDSGAELRLVRVAPDSGENVSITRLALESPLVAVRLPVRLAAEVTNFSSSTAQGLTLQIRRDGHIIRREPVEAIEPGQSTVATISLEFSTGGTHTVETRVAPAGPDVLEEDDVRYLSIEVRESIPVLLVDGRPGRTLLSGEAGFLATALAPQAGAAFAEELELGPSPAAMAVTPFKPKVVSVPELDAEAWPEYDVIVLCNVPRLSPEQWRRLEHFTSRGGGLLVFAGGLVSTSNYNRYGYANGAGLIPGRVGRPTEHPDHTDPATTAHFLDLAGSAHPIAAGFEGHSASGLFLARVDRYMPIEVDARRTEVVLRFTNGDPALVAAGYELGSVLFFGTTANMAWTNLPAKGDYVSLMFNAVAFLSRHHGDHRNIEVGHQITEPLTPAQSSWPLRVTTTDGRAAEARVEPVGDALTLVYGPVEHAGALTASIGPEVRSFAANVNPAGCDVLSLDAKTLVDVLDRPVTVIDGADALAGPAPTPRASELASAGLYVVLALLLGEMWLAMRFRVDQAMK